MSLTKASYSMITGAPANVLDFGATGDGVTDDTVAIQAALNSGANNVYAPAGTYICTASISISPETILRGDGVNTLFLFNVVGDGFTSVFPVNTSNAANITISDLEVQNTNGLNTGGGFAQTCGSYINIYRTVFRGWAYGVIFDQTEHAHVRDSQFHANTIGGIWLVNGPTRTPGAANSFTNRISITGTQFNANTTGIIDDGGVSHDFSDNNFNGGQYGIWVAGALAVNISNNEIEYTTIAGIRATSVRQSTLTSVGQCFQVGFTSNYVISSTNTAAITVANGTGFSFTYNNMQPQGSSTTAAITGIANIVGMVAFSNTQTNYASLFDSTLTTGNLQTKTQFYSPSNITTLESYVPNAGSGGTPIGGIDLSANNSTSSKTVYAQVRPAILSNVAGAESGYLFTYIINAGALTLATVTQPTGFKTVLGFGCNGKNPQAAAVSGGTVAGVIAALVANGILAS